MLHVRCHNEVQEGQGPVGWSWKECANKQRMGHSGVSFNQECHDISYVFRAPEMSISFYNVSDSGIIIIIIIKVFKDD